MELFSCSLDLSGLVSARIVDFAASDKKTQKTQNLDT